MSASKLTAGEQRALSLAAAAFLTVEAARHEQILGAARRLAVLGLLRRVSIDGSAWFELTAPGRKAAGAVAP